jgi:hypothetical protein
MKTATGSRSRMAGVRIRYIIPRPIHPDVVYGMQRNKKEDANYGRRTNNTVT